MLVDAEHEGAVGQLPLELLQPGETEVAEAGVVVAALRVVEVGDDGDGQPERGQQVEAVQPEGVGADLVDLVDGHRGDAQRQRGRAREHQRPAGTARPQEVGQHVGHGRSCPLAERERRAAGSGEQPVRAADPRQGLLEGDRVAGVGAPQLRHLDSAADGLAEVLHRPVRDDVGVGLEPVGRVEEHGARLGPPEAVEHLPVDLDHRRRGLAGAHDRQQAGHRVLPEGRHCVVQHRRHLDRVLRVDVVVRRPEPVHPAGGQRRQGPRHRGFLLGRRRGVAVVGR